MAGRIVSLSRSDAHTFSKDRLQAELLTELKRAGFDFGPGRLGENVLTEGLDLLGMPTRFAACYPAPHWRLERV